MTQKRLGLAAVSLKVDRVTLRTQSLHHGGREFPIILHDERAHQVSLHAICPASVP